MQSVYHEYTNELSVFNDIEKLYYLFSDRKVTPLAPLVVDESCKQLVEIFHRYTGIDYNIKYIRKPVKSPITTGFGDGNVILCHSGGKDSTAAILRLKEQGYNVYLYHLKGANRFYYDEYKASEQLAKKLGVALHFDEMHYSGYHNWIEHPMKNMIMANGAINWGIRAGIGTNIAFGNFSDSTLEVDPFDVCGGDCKEMWQAYEHIIQTAIPKFRMTLPLQNLKDTMDIMVANPELIPLTQSCMTPNRFRESLRKKNLEKYGEPVLEHRCGSCWKCAVEYIWFTDYGIFEFNENYYNHCLQILMNTYKKETKTSYVTVEDIWSNYFFYDFEKSSLQQKNHIV